MQSPHACIFAGKRKKPDSSAEGAKKLAPMFHPSSDVNLILKTVFGHDSFKSPLQEQAVRAVLKGIQ